MQLRFAGAFLLLASLPRAAVGDEPPAATAWLARLRQYYVPHRDLRGGVSLEAPSNLVPSCRSDAPGAPYKPWDEGFEFEPWSVGASVHFADENLFFKNLMISIGRLRADGDLIARWEKAAKRKGKGVAHAPDSHGEPDAVELPPPCPAMKSYMALLQVGRDVLRVDASCDDMKSLYPYELADLFEVATAGGEKPNAKMVVDYCGDMEIRIDDSASLATLKNKKRKTYGDHLMPDDREALKAKARAAKPDPAGALARAQHLRKPLDECIRDHAHRHVVPDPVPITISPAGTVLDVGLGENPPRKLYRCVQWITRTWQFEPQGERVTVPLPAKRGAR